MTSSRGAARQNLVAHQRLQTGRRRGRGRGSAGMTGSAGVVPLARGDGVKSDPRAVFAPQRVAVGHRCRPTRECRSRILQSGGLDGLSAVTLVLSQANEQHGGDHEQGCADRGEPTPQTGALRAGPRTGGGGDLSISGHDDTAHVGGPEAGRIPPPLAVRADAQTLAGPLLYQNPFPLLSPLLIPSAIHPSQGWDPTPPRLLKLPAGTLQEGGS